MGATDKFETVEAALSASSFLLTVEQIATSTGIAEKAVRAELKALAQRGRIEHIPASGGNGGRYGIIGSETKPPQYDPDSVSFDPAKRADANKRRAEDAEHDLSGALQVIYDIRKAIGDPTGKIMLCDLAEHIREIYKLGEAHKLACMSWETSMMQAVGEDGVSSVVAAIERLKSERDHALEEDLWIRAHIAANPKESTFDEVVRIIATERQARQALQEQFDNDPGVDVKDAASGYVVLASKRKPRRITRPESARDAAISAIRAGAQRAEVFALVPIGRALRGAVWKDAQ